MDLKVQLSKRTSEDIINLLNLLSRKLSSRTSSVTNYIEIKACFYSKSLPISSPSFVSFILVKSDT